MRGFIFFLLLASFANANLLVQTKEESSNAQWTQPRIVLVNSSSESVQNVWLEYVVQVESGRTPILQVFQNAPGVSIELISKSTGLWSVKISYSNPIAPGESHNYGTGVFFGLHLDNWGNWNTSDDPSYKDPIGLMQVNDRIVVQGVVSPISSSSQAIVSSSSVSGSCATQMFYDGETHLHMDFLPYDWPEPYELKTNHGILGQLLQPPYLRVSGQKSISDDWVSLYRLPTQLDLRGAIFSFQIYSTGLSQWRFRFQDSEGRASTYQTESLPVSTARTIQLPVNSEDIAGFDASKVVGVFFEATHVPAYTYAHTYLDQIQVECGPMAQSSSSAVVSSSSLNSSSSILFSSSSAVGRLLVQVVGSGLVKPGTDFAFDVGRSIQLWFEPTYASKLIELVLDSKSISISNPLNLIGDGKDHLLDVVYEADPGLMRDLEVHIGEHGRANLEGSFLVRQGSDHTLYFYPDVGYQLKSITGDLY